ncbi:hypothetical protein BDV35DRAFT_396314 [Aspergillus flavus]|uniref:Protein kinase domain-containing protein n=1 Tax=Aspergillus flavus TaxID=5059 RepID=A0A5N6GRA5_ASPFL|nr:hypothetical protein BDV35DRAFT_396314 [Aspergillus flavus]
MGPANYSEPSHPDISHASAQLRIALVSQQDEDYEPAQHQNTYQTNGKTKDRVILHSIPRKVIKGSTKSLGLEQVASSKSSASSTLIIRERESPWDTFQQAFNYDLAGTVIIAVRRSRPTRFKAIREYGAEHAEKILQIFGHFRHKNIISAEECYRDGTMLYVLVDDLPYSLDHLVALHDIYPNESQLASIIIQILHGMSYIAAAGFEHNALTCSTVLFHPDGSIKIAALELCEKCQPIQLHRKSIRELAGIMMCLMQKYEKRDGVVGVDDIERWPIGSDAVGFLSATTSAKSITELEQKPPTSSSAVQVDSFTSATAEAVDGSMAHKTCTVPGNIS